MRPSHWRQQAALALCTLILLAACGRGGAAPDTTSIRTPRPTFTPTALPASAATTAEAATTTPVPANEPVQASEPATTEPPAPAEAQNASPAAGASAKVLAIINTELVNAREGPGTNYPVVMVLGRGEEFQITGRSADDKWWRICCVDGNDVWVVAEFVDTEGAVDAVAIEDGDSAPSAQANQAASQPETAAGATNPTQQEASAVTPTAVVATGGADAPVQFQLVAKEQFPESSVVRIFLYVYDKTSKEGAAGYSLKVSKNGVEQTVSGESFGGRPGLTWPVADPRQRSQNFKVEFPGVAPEGSWEITLVQNGVAVGTIASFALVANDPNRELYVRYER